MSRLTAATILALATWHTPALGQFMTTVPGPGGVPLAPGAPVHGYTPGGIGPGGVEVAPGAAARDVPMYRIGPGGIVMPPRADPRRPEERNATVTPSPACPNGDCFQEILPHTLVLTITSRDAGEGKAPAPDAQIDSIHGLFAALRACWGPPARREAREGMQMSVRFSFKRSGELIGPPFVTYATPGANADTKRVYRRMIQAAVERCAPMPFSKSFGAAIAGSPISIRYVDDRNLQAGTEPPR